MKTVSKKLLSLLLVAMLLVSAVPFQAFADNEHAAGGGDHKPAAEWSTDEAQHWHACITEDSSVTCTRKEDLANHTWDNGKCSDCKYTCIHVDSDSDNTCDKCGLDLNPQTVVEETFKVQLIITGDTFEEKKEEPVVTAKKNVSDGKYTLDGNPEYFAVSADGKSIVYNAKAAAKDKLTSLGKTQFVELVDKNNVSENVALVAGDNVNKIYASVACSSHVFKTDGSCQYCGYKMDGNSANLNATVKVYFKNNSGRYLGNANGYTLTVGYNGSVTTGEYAAYFTKPSSVAANEMVFDAAKFAEAVFPGMKDANDVGYIIQRSYNNLTGDHAYDESTSTPKPTVLANSSNVINVIMGYEKSTYNVQLVLKGGIVNNATPATLNYTVTYGGEQLTLPTVTSPESSKVFKGWSLTDGGDIYLKNGAIVPEQTQTLLTLYAVFETQKATLNVTFVDAKGNYMNQVQYACDFNQTIDSVLTSNRRTEIQTRVMNDHPGYTWDGYFYTGRTGSNGVTMGQTLENISQIFIHLKARTYTLALNLNGGTYNGKSSIDNKTDIADGTSVSLPIPRYATADKVFTGWKDSVTNQVYTVGTDGKINMTVHSDTDRSTITLIAQWGDQAKVLLKIFANNELYSSDICIDVTNLLSGNTLYKTVVDKIVQARYTSNGGTMTISNLYDASAWNQYTANKKTNSGVEAITVGNSSSGNVVYVMVNNAKMSNQAVNVNNNTGNPNLIGNAYPTSTTPYDRSNPKTGDESYIGTAAVVMMVSAAALAGAWYFYKKKDLI